MDIKAPGKGCYFLVFVQLSEKYGTLIERNTALIEKVSALTVQICDSGAKLSRLALCSMSCVNLLTG
eukprot:SAG31_NODE_1974_length_6755_cov_6.833383_2_plen_67_part_00